jgi:hypothetical protein
VRNGGGLALSHVRVVDPGCRGAPSLGSSGNGDQILDPGEVWRYGCAIRITPATGRVLATAATVTARSSGGGVRASDRATVRVLRPDVTIRVTTFPVSGAVGDPITYRFVVRNIGDSTLTGLSIDDDQLGHIGSIPTLVPGHDAVVSTVRVLSVRHVWVTDTATVTGSDPSGSSVHATDQAVVTIVDAGTQPSSGGTGGGTAFTGSSTAVPAGAAVVLVIAGLAALLTARRRRS